MVKLMTLFVGAFITLPTIASNLDQESNKFLVSSPFFRLSNAIYVARSLQDRLPSEYESDIYLVYRQKGVSVAVKVQDSNITSVVLTHTPNIIANWSIKNHIKYPYTDFLF